MRAVKGPQLASQFHVSFEMIGRSSSAGLPCAARCTIEQSAAFLYMVELGTGQSDEVDAIEEHAVAFARIVVLALRACMRCAAIVFNAESGFGPVHVADDPFAARNARRSLRKGNRLVEKSSRNAEASAQLGGKGDCGELGFHSRSRLRAHMARNRARELCPLGVAHLRRKGDEARGCGERPPHEGVVELS